MSRGAVFMQCGHTAQATNADGEPTCVICIGLTDGADKPAAAPDLTGRTAVCTSCKNKRPSSLDLAFFQAGKPDGYDLYYCGCRGWD